jgi:hypothetical protein
MNPLSADPQRHRSQASSREGRFSRFIKSLNSGSVALVRAVRRTRVQRRFVCVAVAFNLLLLPGPGIFSQHLIAFSAQVINTRIGESHETYYFRSLLISVLFFVLPIGAKASTRDYARPSICGS